MLARGVDTLFRRRGHATYPCDSAVENGKSKTLPRWQFFVFSAAPEKKKQAGVLELPLLVSVRSLCGWARGRSVLAVAAQSLSLFGLVRCGRRALVLSTLTSRSVPSLAGFSLAVLGLRLISLSSPLLLAIRVDLPHRPARIFFGATFGARPASHRHVAYAWASQQARRSVSQI